MENKSNGVNGQCQKPAFKISPDLLSVLHRSRSALTFLTGPLCSGKTFALEFMNALLLEELPRTNALTATISMSGEMKNRMQQSDPIGRALLQFKPLSDMGELVPDDLTLSVALDGLQRECLAMAGHNPYRGESRNILIDGFPRTAAQEAFIRSLHMPWTAICFTAPKKLCMERSQERLKKLGRADDANMAVLENRWSKWIEFTLPTFERMSSYDRNSVVWIDGRLPLQRKINLVLKQMVLKKKTYVHLRSCLYNPKHAVTKTITAVDKPAPKAKVLHPTAA